MLHSSGRALKKVSHSKGISKEKLHQKTPSKQPQSHGRTKKRCPWDVGGVTSWCHNDWWADHSRLSNREQTSNVSRQTRCTVETYLYLQLLRCAGAVRTLQIDLVLISEAQQQSMARVMETDTMHNRHFIILTFYNNMYEWEDLKLQTCAFIQMCDRWLSG